MTSVIRGQAARTVFAAMAMCSLWSGAAAGQTPEVRVGVAAGRAFDERGEGHGAVTVAPTLTWSGLRSTLGLGGQGVLFAGGAALGSAGAWGTAVAVEQGPLALTLGGEGWVTGSTNGYRAAQAAFRPRVRIAAAGWGLEGGPHGSVGVQTAPGGALGWPQRSLFSPGSASESETRSALGWGAAGWVESGSLALRADWSASQAEEVRWADWSLESAIALDGVRIGARAGARSGDLRETWASGRLAAEVMDGVALVVEGGRAPSQPMTGRQGGSFVSAGLSLSLDARGRTAGPVSPAPLAGGPERTISLKARPGARVELFADWNGWKGELVPETQPGRYGVEVRLQPGTHRFAFRVDGEWKVPAGYEVEDSDFGGKRAVVRVSAQG